MRGYPVLILLLTLLIIPAVPLLADDHTILSVDTGKKDSAIAHVDSAIQKRGPDYIRAIRFDLGFAHWVSDRFRTAILGKDLGIGIGINPGIPYLQLQARFDYSKIRTVQSDTSYAQYNGRFIGFTNLGLALYSSFTKNVQTVIVTYSAGVVLVAIKGRPLAAGMSGGFGIDYLIRYPKWKHHSMGVSMAMRSQTYNLTDEKAEFKEWFSANKVHLDRDLNVILGFVVAFF